MKYFAVLFSVWTWLFPVAPLPPKVTYGIKDNLRLTWIPPDMCVSKFTISMLNFPSLWAYGYVPRGTADLYTAKTIATPTCIPD